MIRDVEPPARHRSDLGFTLIEMIVTLALLALIAALLASSLYGMRRMFAVASRNEVANSLVAVRSYLHTALEQASPAAGGTTASNPQPALVGDAASLSFRTSYAPRGQLQGFYRVDLALETSAGRRIGSDLVLTQVLMRPVPQDTTAAKPPPARRVRLVPGVTSIGLAYFGTPDDSGGAPSWHDSWAAAGRLPQLVRITLHFPPGDERFWPPLNVSLPMAGANNVRCNVRAPC